MPDTIMPSFVFAAGYSYQLSALRRFSKLGTVRAYGHFLVLHGLALILVSLVMYAAEDLNIKSWSGCDLRLISSLNDAKGIPTAGKNLLILADVDHVIHFRPSTMMAGWSWTPMRKS